MTKKNLLIYGAGAIGRGYLPWVFSPSDFNFYYVEANAKIRALLRSHKSFTTYRTVGNQYESMTVGVQACFEPGEETVMIQQADVVATAVGPRNFFSLRPMLNQLSVPVICCENDASLPAIMKEWTGNEKVVFAIPDVITSNTANKDLLNQDPLAIITESGECFIDQVVSDVPAACSYVSENELAKQWAAKLYVHNTPHCIAAYLGSLLGLTYLHEAMENQRASEIVEGAMDEMVAMLLTRPDMDRDFLKYYRNKELDRFRNQLLFDPITRVAREPFRKLALDERLIGAAQQCLAVGIMPHNILLGIMAAFCFDSEDDPDSHIKYLVKSLTPSEFLRTILRLRDNEALSLLLVDRWDSLLTQVKVLHK
jgi:mannitol-1-phosphate 5-dehydrogenase